MHNVKMKNKDIIYIPDLNDPINSHTKPDPKTW